MEATKGQAQAHPVLARTQCGPQARLGHYEEGHQPIYPPDPIEAIRFRMDQLGLVRKALEPSIGSRARVSEVLSGKRSLTLEMIRRLHQRLGIPAEVLLAS